MNNQLGYNDDWDRVLEDTLEWTGREYTETIIEKIVSKSNPKISFLLTLGPGMVGTEAWIFREKYPDIDIIGLEPQIERYNFLKDKFPGVLLNKAAGAQECIVDGWMGHKDGKSDFWLNASPENSKYYKKKKVQCTTVDKILENIDGFGLLWMDIEGAEFEAIRGALGSLMTGKVAFISLEMNFNSKDPTHCEASMIIALMWKLGYIAVGTAAPCSTKESEDHHPYIDQIIVDNHTDILFAKVGNSGIPIDYLNVYLNPPEEK